MTMQVQQIKHNGYYGLLLTDVFYGWERLPMVAISSGGATQE